MANNYWTELKILYYRHYKRRLVFSGRGTISEEHNQLYVFYISYDRLRWWWATKELLWWHHSRLSMGSSSRQE